MLSIHCWRAGRLSTRAPSEPPSPALQPAALSIKRKLFSVGVEWTEVKRGLAQQASSPKFQRVMEALGRDVTRCSFKASSVCRVHFPLSDQHHILKRDTRSCYTQLRISHWLSKPLVWPTRSQRPPSPLSSVTSCPRPPAPVAHLLQYTGLPATPPACRPHSGVRAFALAVPSAWSPHHHLTADSFVTPIATHMPHPQKLVAQNNKCV